MKRMIKQWMAGLLAAVLVLTLLPAAALADQPDGEAELPAQETAEAVPEAEEATPVAAELAEEPEEPVEEAEELTEEAEEAAPEAELTALEDVPMAIAFDGANGGDGNADTPYEINTLEQFKAFRDYINGGNGSGEYFKLTASINLGGSDEWTPIGTDETHPFQGTFDGGGFTISGLCISIRTTFNAGLFGYSNGGTIKNLMVSGSITDGQWAGGIVGYNKGSIQNCCYSGTVQGSDAGGIAGNNYGSGSIENCYYTGTVSSSGHAGGITGLNTSSGSVSNCYYLSTCGAEGVGTSKTEEEFKSGEVTWLLQNGQDAQVWGQTLGGSGDNYPVLTTDINKKVCKVIFATEEEKEYAAKYTNQNGTVEMPENPERDNFTFKKWVKTQGADGEEFNAETQVTEDMTVYAVGSITSGATGECKFSDLDMWYYYEYDAPITVNLDECMKKAFKISEVSEGSFTYVISDQGTTNATIESGNILTIPTGLNKGEYPITITATEKTPQYSLMSLDSDSDLTLIVRCNIYGKREEQPNIAIDYENEMLTGFEIGASYTIDLFDVYPEDGKLSAVNYMGESISIVKKARDGNHTDSTLQNLDVPARPAAPVGPTGVAPTTHDGNGKITGADTTMEYREKTDGNTEAWQGCTAEEFEVAPNKTYEVRTKAVAESAFASEIKEVNVPAFTPTTITGTVTIDGEVKLGQQLTAVTTAVVPSDIDFTYQWQRSGDGGYTDIGGATAKTYTLTVADVGKTIQVVVTAHDPDYTGSLTSTATGEVPKGTITGIEVTANPGITAYTGEEQTLVNVTGNQDSDTIEYKVEKKGDSDDYSEVGTENKATDAGTYKVTVTVQREGYEDHVSDGTEVTIAKAESSATAPKAKEDLTYTGAPQQLIDAGTATGGTMKYYVGESAPSDGDSQWKTEAAQITGTEAKEYKVWYYVAGNDNYNGTTALSITATIGKAAPEVTPPTALELTYTGEAQTLAKAGSADGGTMTYSDSEGGTYSDSIPQGTEAKTYEVWYKVTGDANHTDATPAKIDVTIDQAAPVVTVEADPGIYGQDITITAGVTSGEIGAENITGAVTFTAGETELGTAEAKDVGGRWTLTVLGTERAKQQALFGEAGTSTVTAQYSGNTNIAEGSGEGAATVAAKALTYTVTAEDREYNGANTIDVTLTPNDLVAGDTVTLSATGTLSSANAETYTTVYLSDITKAGADEKYYSVTDPIGGTMILGGVIISPRVVTLAWTLDGGETFAVDYTGEAHTAAATVSNTVNSDDVNVTVEVTGDDGADEAIEVGDYTATATALTGAAQGNYTLVGCANATQAFTIQKVAAAVTTEPQANTGLTYTAAPQALVTAGTPTGGTMVYALGDSAEAQPADEAFTGTVPAAANAGTYYVWWKVQGDVDHRDTAPACVTVAIAQAAATVTAPTANAGLTYTGGPQALIAAGNVESAVEGCGTMQYSLEAEGDFAAAIPTGTDAKTYTVYWKVDGADETNYNYNGDISGQVTVAIAKAQALVTEAPTPVTAAYTGEAITLVTGGASNFGTLAYSLTETGPFTATATAVNAGTYTVYYKVEGTDNWNASEVGSVQATIEKVASSATAPTAKALTYTGAAQALVEAGTATGGIMKYALGDAAPADDSQWVTDAAQLTGTAAGTYTIWYYVAGDANHNDATPDKVTVTIDKAQAAVTVAPTPVTATYTGEAITLVTAGESNFGALVYSLAEAGPFTAAIPTATEAGRYTVYYMVEGTENWDASEVGSVQAAIRKAASSAVPPTANAGLTYTGAAQALVTAGQTVDGAEVYALGTSATDAPAEGYELAVPTAANAGTYYVWWKVQGDIDHSDTAPICVTVTIAPAALSFEPVAVETPYTGAAIFVTVAQTAGQTPAIDPEKLAVSYEQDGAAVEPILPGIYDVLVNLTDANFTLADGAERVKVGTLTITHVHVYAEEWAHDEANHWHVCQGVGACDAPQSGLAAHAWDEGVVALEPTVEAEGSRLYTCSVCGATRSEAISKLNTYQISGIVTDHAGNPLAGAAVRLTQGSDTVAEAVTDDQGRYSFSSVPAGLYNVAATWDEVTKTILVELSDADASQRDIQMPEGKTTSVVEVLGEDTPDVVVGGVDAVAEAEAASPDEVVTVTLTVAKEEEPASKDEIDQLVTGKKDDVLYLDLSLLKQVNTQPTQAITDTGARVLEIVVPYDFSAKRSVTVYRKHGDDPAAALTALSAQPDLAAAEDGTFFADRENGRIAIYASKFSTYAIAYQAEATASTSGGSSSVARYTITATAGEGGTIDPAGATQVRRGDSQSYAIRPEAGYAVADVLVDGASVGAVTTYTFENVAAAHTIQAVFQKAGEGASELPFTDVASGDWFYDSVKDIYQRGLMQGVAATTFAPDQSTTRAMVVTILYRLEGEPGAPRNIAFADVAPGLWYTDAISWAAASGIVEGYSPDAFGPEDLVTREQLATILRRYAAYKGADVSGQADLTGYTDASAVSAWASDAMTWAVQAGLIQGRSATTLAPAGTSTRAELAAVLARYLQA